MTVDELLNNISAKEIAEWRAYDMFEPIGDKRLDINFGYLAYLVCQVAGGDKDKKAWMVDYILDFEHNVLTKEQRLEKKKQIDHQKVHGGDRISPEELLRAFKRVGKSK